VAAEEATEGARLQQEQQQQQQLLLTEEEEAAFDEDERAHAVPGVHAVEHDGVLGVRQSLLDLEPLPDSLLEQQQQQQASPSRGSSSSSSGSGSGSGSGYSAGGGSSAPASSFDPLGAMAHPPPAAPVAPASGELISLDADPEEAAPAASQQRSGPAAPLPPHGGVRSQLQDLLL
jgi:hypothetical protein